MNKKMFLIPVIVGVIAIVSTTAIFAQTPTPNPQSTAKTFASRVASILGLNETQVQSALDQASKDTQNDAVKARLDAMVAAGKLTQAQADEYLNWYNARPEGLKGGFGFGGPMQMHRGGRGFGFGHPGKSMVPGSPAPAQTPTQTPAA